MGRYRMERRLIDDFEPVYYWSNWKVWLKNIVMFCGYAFIAGLYLGAFYLFFT